VSTDVRIVVLLIVFSVEALSAGRRTAARHAWFRSAPGRRIFAGLL